MRTRNGVWVGFQQTESRNPQVNVLSRMPLKMNILDGQHGD